MKLLKLIFKNTFRHKLRTILTILGLAITIMSFGIVRNILVLFDVSRADLIEGHLICRNKTSMMQFLPVSHIDKIKQVDGVLKVGYAHWVGRKYGENAEDFFTKMAVSPGWLEIRTDMGVSEEDQKAFRANKRGCLITHALATDMGWDIGSQITVRADFFEGVSYDVTVVGFLNLKQDERAQARFMVFRVDYFTQNLAEAISPEMDNTAGWIEILADPDNAAEVGKRIDSVFMNSKDETLTETVDAFASNQVERFRTIINALQISSYLMIVVILLVLLNTMSLVARERISENAVLKTLGFRPVHLIFMNFGESLLVAILGGVLGAFLIWPGIELFKVVLGAFRSIEYNYDVLIWLGPSVVIVGLLAAIVPIIKALRTTIVDGLRTLE